MLEKLRYISNSIVFNNLILLLFAMILNWNIVELMLSFLIQSIFFQIFTIIQIHFSNNFSVSGILILDQKDDKRIKKDLIEKLITFIIALIFIFGGMLIFFGKSLSLDISRIIIWGTVNGIYFFINYLSNLKDKINTKINLESVYLISIAKGMTLFIPILVYIFIQDFLDQNKLNGIILIIFVGMKILIDLIIEKISSNIAK